MAVDFLIVGAGIGGAVLATLLARAGKRVLVIEKQTAPPPIARPEILWPATVEFLNPILSAEEIRESALIPLRSLEFVYKKRTLARISSELFAGTAIQPWSSDGDETRRLLLEGAQCEIERGTEVIGLLRESGRVVGVRARATSTGIERDISARWTIGDDGGHSVVRSECGIKMVSNTVPVDLLSFGIQWPSFMEPGAARAWINPERTRTGLFVMAALARPGGRGSALIAARPRLLQDNQAVQSAIESFCAADSGVAEIIGNRRYPQDLARVRLSWGHAACYGAAGAVLIGDAAHTVTPAGGQGANMAIADARAVAEIALLDETRLVSDYEHRRRPANERSLRLSRAASRVLSLPDFVLAPPIPILFSLLNTFPQLFGRGLRFASTAFLEKAS